MTIAALRFIHIVEIMSQNVCLGMTAVWLLRAKAARTVAPMQVAHTV